MKNSLVSGFLERIASTVFDLYHDEITKLVGKQHGVYALYKRNQLYYVGLARNLRTRVKNHLRDKHANKWDTFSLYLIRNVEHLREIESLLIRIAGPRGNIKKGAFMGPQNLIKTLRQLMQDRNKMQVDTILSAGQTEKRSAAKSKKKSKRPGMRGNPPLAGFLLAGSQLRATYKKKEYMAQIDHEGRIILDGMIFNSPSAAGAHVRSGKATDGWMFWKYEVERGHWAIIDQLRRSK